MRTPREKKPASLVISTEQEIVTGIISSVVYHNDENGYTVLHVETEDGTDFYKSKPFTIVGRTQAAWEGEEVRAEGQWIVDPTHGRQFKAETITCVAPRSVLGIERYLSSGLIRGVGKVTAKRIVETFGDQTLKVLTYQSARLVEVPKLGKATIAKIRESWKQNEELREAMLFGQTYGISVGRMTKICRRYGHDTVAVIKANPYRLCDDIWGIGFATADKIALSVGIEKDSPLRARATLRYVLQQGASEEGHCWTYENDLLLQANELTSIPVEVLGEALEAELKERHLVADARADGEVRRVYLRNLYWAERSVAQSIAHILQTPRKSRVFDTLRAIAWWEKTSHMTLATQQRVALQNSLGNKFSIITGGPGVGKTTIICALVEIFSAAKAQVVLAAPTGRAAKRMSEAVGVEARTIHRLLKWNPVTGSFSQNEDNPCEGDVFIFDETSMIDIRLAADLFSALPANAVVIWVGDTDQLPSVGPGFVLADLIHSDQIPCVKLDHIFRQDSSGLIVRNAHHVNRGEPLELKSSSGASDFYFVPTNDPEECLKRVIAFMTERIPRTFGFDPLHDIQILTPMRRNLLGAENLNTVLQAQINPKGPSVIRGGTVFRVGDRVMQIRNNYDKEVFNGDVGFVRQINSDDRQVVVLFDSRHVVYDAADLDELVLAYATTVHKSQGSEYPAVIVILHTQHYVMLRRNLLYTAMTRGRKLVVVVGAKYAVDKAIANNTVAERRTSLADFIVEVVQKK